MGFSGMARWSLSEVSHYTLTGPKQKTKSGKITGSILFPIYAKNGWQME